MAKAQETSTDKGPIIGWVCMTRVVKTSETIHGGGTATIGEFVDAALARAAQAGETIQNVAVEFSEEQWQALSPVIAGMTTRQPWEE